MALGLMRGEPKLANTRILVEVIRQPRSSFEQWQALRVCQDLIKQGNARSSEMKEIREAIAATKANGSLDSASDRSRSELAHQILKAMSAEQRQGDTA
jgi:hypothetical protein